MIFVCISLVISVSLPFVAAVPGEPGQFSGDGASAFGVRVEVGKTVQSVPSA